MKAKRLTYCLRRTILRVVPVFLCLWALPSQAQFRDFAFEKDSSAWFSGCNAAGLTRYSGTTITAAAHWLGLATEEEKIGNDFGIELPDELESKLSELKRTVAAWGLRQLRPVT